MKKSKKPAQTKRPKGSYPLPTGGYVVRRGPITSIRRDPPDMDKLAEAFLHLAEQLGPLDCKELNADNPEEYNE